MPKKAEEEVKNEPIINTEAAKAKAAEVAGNVKEGANNFVEKVKNDKALLAVCCAVCVVVVVVLFVLLSTTVFNGSKKAVKTYGKAIVKMDEKKMCKQLHKNMLEEDYEDLDECYDSWEKIFERMEDSEIKYKKFEIKNKKVLDKDDVEDMAEKLEEKYDINEKHLKKVVRYSVDFDAKGSENDQKLYLYAGKIKGKWYIIDEETR